MGDIMKKTNLFTERSNDKLNQFIDQAIQGINDDTQLAWKEFNQRYRYQAPEIRAPEHNRLRLAEIAQNRRVATLKKIKTGQHITEAEHQHLMKLQPMNDCDGIKNYAHVDPANEDSDDAGPATPRA